MTALVYTQHSVAFPNLLLNGTSVVDELSLSLEPDGGGTIGEMKWTFMRFSPASTGVQMAVFGDGLPCLFDERVQAAVDEWRAMADPDEVTPNGLIAILVEHGAEPSRYHREPVR
jgi:hypothetical protein